MKGEWRRGPELPSLIKGTQTVSLHCSASAHVTKISQKSDDLKADD